MRAAPEAVQDSRSKVVSADKFSSAHRLLRGDGFDQVIRAANNIADRYFKVFYIPNGKENARLGIVSSKRTLPRAVDRNRAKRMVREAFRRHGIKARALDMVVLVRPAYAQDAREQRSAINNNLGALFGKVESKCADL